MGKGTSFDALLADALAFYADEQNWRSPSRGFAAQYDPEPSPIDRDRGDSILCECGNVFW